LKKRNGIEEGREGNIIIGKQYSTTCNCGEMRGTSVRRVLVLVVGRQVANHSGKSKK
jgi:hypothetical protein